MSLVKKESGSVVPVAQTQKSALEDELFANVKDKAERWLKIVPKSRSGREMDSVFFNDDRFELMVDTRGYSPEDLKCTISPNTIEVIAQRQEISGASQRCVSASRSYQLPQMVWPQQAVCCLSSDGLLMVAVPWQK